MIGSWSYVAENYKDVTHGPWALVVKGGGMSQKYTVNIIVYSLRGTCIFLCTWQGIVSITKVVEKSIAKIRWLVKWRCIEKSLWRHKSMNYHMMSGRYTLFKSMSWNYLKETQSGYPWQLASVPSWQLCVQNWKDHALLLLLDPMQKLSPQLFHNKYKVEAPLQHICCKMGSVLLLIHGKGTRTSNENQGGQDARDADRGQPGESPNPNCR